MRTCAEIVLDYADTFLVLLRGHGVSVVNDYAGGHGDGIVNDYILTGGVRRVKTILQNNDIVSA